MLKLYITLEDDDGQKVERVLQFREDETIYPTDQVDQMIDSLKSSKKPL